MSSEKAPLKEVQGIMLTQDHYTIKYIQNIYEVIC